MIGAIDALRASLTQDYLPLVRDLASVLLQIAAIMIRVASSDCTEPEVIRRFNAHNVAIREQGLPIDVSDLIAKFKKKDAGGNVGLIAAEVRETWGAREIFRVCRC